MKCDYCGANRNDVTAVGHSMYTMTTWICPDCAKSFQKMGEELRGEWKEKATCPACGGKLRKQGDTNTSVAELGQMIYKAVTYFNPVTMVTRFVTGIGKAIFSEAKGEVMSKVRQCSKCDAYATKCPKCSKIFIVGKPQVFDGTSAKCPKCGQKIIAFE